MAAVDHVRLPSVSYPKSIWSDAFTSFTLDDQVQGKYAEAIEVLKEEARSMLKAQEGNTTNVCHKLVLIDTIERLGVGYHFDQEIENLLQQIFVDFHHDSQDQDDYDLFTTALGFRLLRQHRYHASSGVFDKFKGDDNKLKETLKSDAKGLLSLYEAAHLRIHGEEILDEAVEFTTHHLNLMLNEDLFIESPALEDQVKQALQKPLHRVVPRIEARQYISSYGKDVSRNEMLLKLAKLDFNYVQNIHKQELSQLTRWWNEFDLMAKLPFARSRLVEVFLWASAFHFEPQFSSARVEVSKCLQVLTLIDDIYDNYATIDEADLFTELMERWNNIDEMGQDIPEYMETVRSFTVGIYDDHERDATKQGKTFAVPYAIETVKQICRAYNKGLKWCMGRETPTFEEYIVNTEITSCLYSFCAIMTPGMKSVSSKETIDWLMSSPKFVIASTNVCRYLDDVSSYERESKQGQMLTGVDFYAKEHGLTAQEAADKFVQLAEDAWKDMNTELIKMGAKSSPIPKDMLELILNYARVSEAYYRTLEDGYSKPEVMTHHIVALFVEPIIII